MVRTIVKLAISALIVHALYRFVPVYLHYQQFKDAVNETALFSKEKPDNEVVDRVMHLAERYEVPVAREYVDVRRDPEHTYIDVVYVEEIEWLPGYKRPHQFTIAAQGWHVRPTTASDVIR